VDIRENNMWSMGRRERKQHPETAPYVNANTTRRKQVNKKLKIGIAAVAVALSLAACSSDADVASRNVSKAADNFEVARRIVFYNGITDKYILEIDGYCSLGNDDPAGELSVTCKTGPGQFKKHFLGLSDNVTYFAEQLDSKNVSTQHYRVIFKPSTVLPDVDVR
jgi:hypothetical protein